MWTGGIEAETDPAGRPKPPTGQGPVLEWFRESRRATHKVVGLGFVVLVVPFTLMDGDLEWATGGWWAVFFWGVILATLALLYAGGRVVSLAAGAEWFSCKGRDGVRTYELVEVELKARGPVMDLSLKDTAGREADVELRPVEMNPRLWDLVYNGVLHSVHARPVETNRQARGRLRLPVTPAWKRAEDAD
jgi:hypothetical protein